MLELMNGAQIEAEHLGTLKDKPVYEVKKADFIKHYDDAHLGETEGIYFVHEGRGLFKHLIYKGNVVGHLSKGGNVTWFKTAEPWEMLHRPLGVKKEAAVSIVTETKIPQPYKRDGGIADVHYIDNIMNRLLAEGEAFRQQLKGEVNG
jgi:hypothetical protein